MKQNKTLKNEMARAGVKQECRECGISSWQDKPIILELDHINGDNRDSRFENLRLLCPNCHSQTPTWRGRNIKGKRKKCVNVDDDVLLKAYDSCKNISKALTKVGMFPKGGNYAKLKRLLIEREDDDCFYSRQFDFGFDKTRSIEGTKRYWSKPENVEKRRELLKANNPMLNNGANEKRIASLKKTYSDPEKRKAVSEISRKRFEDPAMREKISKSLKKAYADGLYETRKKPVRVFYVNGDVMDYESVVSVPHPKTSVNRFLKGTARRGSSGIDRIVYIDS